MADDTQDKKERLIFELNSDAIEMFDDLARRTGASTRTEFFKNMLRFSSAALDEIESGGTPLIMLGRDGPIVKSTSYRLLIWKIKGGA